jgi:hypothetical protein
MNKLLFLVKKSLAGNPTVAKSSLAMSLIIAWEGSDLSPLF